MSTAPDLGQLPNLPRDDGGPVFQEPWQAQAFALTLKLHEAGYFQWREWAELLSQEIAIAQASGDPDLGDTYYHHWLGALEKLTVAKGLTEVTELLAQRDAWEQAYRHTPHGQPVSLD